jgi:predicted ATPase
MIKRLYVHNFRCLENFELPLDGRSIALLIGRNGTGKSTVGAVLRILQSVSRGTNRVGQLVKPKEFARGRADVPIRLELEVMLAGNLYHYILALELPANFRELRIAEETLLCDRQAVYSRQEAQVTLHAAAQNREAQFLVDWHLFALPLIQRQSESDPLNTFRAWLSQSLILDPIPHLMVGESTGETLQPIPTGQDFAAWLTGLLGQFPAAYATIAAYLKKVMPDTRDFLNESVGRDARSLVVRFETREAGIRVPFDDLSAGEKCFFLCAVVLAANESYGPLFCFWDEPDQFLSLSEVGHFVLSLRRLFTSTGQLLVTSHNPEAIRRFSGENTLVLDRHSHLEPTLIRPLKDIEIAGDLVEALIRGDVGCGLQ